MAAIKANRLGKSPAVRKAAQHEETPNPKTQKVCNPQENGLISEARENHDDAPGGPSWKHHPATAVASAAASASSTATATATAKPPNLPRNESDLNSKVLGPICVHFWSRIAVYISIYDLDVDEPANITASRKLHLVVFNHVRDFLAQCSKSFHNLAELEPLRVVAMPHPGNIAMNLTFEQNEKMQAVVNRVAGLTKRLRFARAGAGVVSDELIDFITALGLDRTFSQELPYEWAAFRQSRMWQRGEVHGSALEYAIQLLRDHQTAAAQCYRSRADDIIRARSNAIKEHEMDEDGQSVASIGS